MRNDTHEAVIGLEVHVQVNTASKMFCACNARYFNEAPNTHVCPVCLGLPGALPVPNKKAIDKCVMLALALNCSINKETKFDRKNYFYPDLPKGYQISQYDQPIGHGGFLEFDLEGDHRRIRITRVHLEEDTGKSLHDAKQTLLDFNKSGVPLIEIVTEPDFESIEEVEKFAKRMRQIVRFTGISDADMEKGQMRFELNISVRKLGEKKLPGYKVEVKNIGSISVLQKVIASEFKRQSKIITEGKTPVQETRGLKDMSGKTVSLRVKEEAHDYRYFPEPDIPPLSFSDSYLRLIKMDIPELPQAKKDRYMSELGLEPDTAETIASSKVKAEWFEAALGNNTDQKLAAQIAKWMIGDLAGLIKADKSKLAAVKFRPTDFRALIEMLTSGKLSGTLAKQVLAEMYKTGKTPEEIVKEKKLDVVVNNIELKQIIDRVIKNNQKIVADVQKNPNAVKFLLGLVMRETKGKADPKLIEKILTDKLLK